MLVAAPPQPPHLYRGVSLHACIAPRCGHDAACRLQSEELRELAKLAMEASELLFEMTAMGDAGDSVKEMVSKAKQLQACLASSRLLTCASPSSACWPGSPPYLPSAAQLHHYWAEVSAVTTLPALCLLGCSLLRWQVMDQEFYVKDPGRSRRYGHFAELHGYFAGRELLTFMSDPPSLLRRRHN